MTDEEFDEQLVALKKAVQDGGHKRASTAITSRLCPSPIESTHPGAFDLQVWTYGILQRLNQERAITGIY